MPQLFHPIWNSIARASILGGAMVFAALVAAGAAFYRSPYVTDVGVVRQQPVPFSHEHHVGAIGLDCRTCHGSVESSAFAGMPDTQTCMSCHARVWAQAPVLEPVRESWRTGRPLHWTRVNDLPDYVYFNHSIHVAKGVGCTTCHGRVDTMPLTWKAESLHMRWCLDCHRHPERFLRPREKVFDVAWSPPPDQEERGRELVRAYGVSPRTDCVDCHR